MRRLLQIGLGFSALLIGGEAASQDRTCPDGGRAYFGYCPTDRPAPNVLQQQLEQWAFYPREVDLKVPPDRLEQLYTNRDPQALYEILAPYDRATVLATPQLGARLQDYKDAYYKFRQGEVAFEEQVFELAGGVVSARNADAWREALNYYLLRANGNSAEALKKGPQITLFIQIDEAERTYAVLETNPTLNARRADLQGQRVKLETTATALTQEIRAASLAPR